MKFFNNIRDMEATTLKQQMSIFYPQKLYIYDRTVIDINVIAIASKRILSSNKS